MGMNVTAPRPVPLWIKICEKFLEKDGDQYVDENTGISVQSFDNRFHIDHWDPEIEHRHLNKLLHRMGYSEGGTKQTQLYNKYMDLEQWEKLKVALTEYRQKDRFTLGMTFKNSPARSGGCLSAFQIAMYEKQERAFVYAKIVEVPKKFAADLLFFNGLLSALNFSGPVTIVPTCVFFWKVTAPLLVPVLGMRSFQHEGFRRHVLKKIKDREHLASPEYAYRNEARTWEYLKPIIDQMIEDGEIRVK